MPLVMNCASTCANQICESAGQNSLSFTCTVVVQHVCPLPCVVSSKGHQLLCIRLEYLSQYKSLNRQHVSYIYGKSSYRKTSVRSRMFGIIVTWLPHILYIAIRMSLLISKGFVKWDKNLFTSARWVSAATLLLCNILHPPPSFLWGSYVRNTYT